MSVKKIKTFKGADYGAMFHFIASTAYDHELTYVTSNGRAMCVASKSPQIVLVFYYGVLVARIDRVAETVEHFPDYCLGTGYDNMLYSLKKAFDHYTQKEVSCFSKVTAEDIKISLEDKDMPSNSTAITGFEHIVCTLENFEVPSEDLTKISKAVQDLRDRRNKAAEERRKAEEARRAEQDRQLKVLTPWLMSLLEGCNSNYDKLKSLMKLYRGFKKSDIPDSLFKEFRTYWNSDDPDSLDTKWIPTALDRENYEDLIDVRKICRYKYSAADLPDGITLIGSKLLTTQGCEVDIRAPQFMLLFKALMHKIKKQEDCSDYYGASVGDYTLREVNYADKFIRVGCHCFLFEDIFELEERIYNAYKLYQG